jgi:hypothetical protein
VGDVDHSLLLAMSVALHNGQAYALCAAEFEWDIREHEGMPPFHALRVCNLPDGHSGAHTDHRRTPAVIQGGRAG